MEFKIYSMGKNMNELGNGSRHTPMEYLRCWIHRPAVYVLFYLFFRESVLIVYFLLLTSLPLLSQAKSVLLDTLLHLLYNYVKF